MGGGSAYNPDAERIHPEPGLAQGLSQGGLMGLQGGDFLSADGAVGCGEGFQPVQFRAEDAVHFFQGGGDGVFLVLAEGPREVVVARRAVLGWRGGGGRAPEPRGVSARLGWAQLLRAVRDDGDDVRLARIDGSQVTGIVDAVARDAVRLGPSGGLTDSSAGTWVVLRAVATLQVL